MLRSLRSQLLVWVLLPLASAVAVDAWVTYRDALDTASVVQDRLLLGSARSIAEEIRFEDGSFQNEIPPAALELFQSTEPDLIYYRITSGAGNLLAGYTDLERPDASVEIESPYFFNSVMRGASVRVVALAQPVIGDPNAMPVIVQVAQTRRGHQQLADKLWRHTVGQQLLILVLASVLIFFSLNWGLRPLLMLRNRVNEREPGSLQPMSAGQMPTELIPLVDSLNDYIRRLEVHAGAQAVFIQNAAHQLRTPFAVLNTQLNYAARASDDAERKESLAAARHTLQQAMRLLKQLLTLSMADSLLSTSTAEPEVSIDWMATVREVFENLSAQAQSKNINLGFEMPVPPAATHASPVVIREIVMNLVDNAIRYTPDGGCVTVRIESENGQTVLCVEDNGVGIPAELREKVFERFYRVHNTDSNGSGLGLAIVRELASKINARVTLATPANGTGLVVSVRLGSQIS